MWGPKTGGRRSLRWVIWHALNFLFLCYLSCCIALYIKHFCCCTMIFVTPSIYPFVIFTSPYILLWSSCYENFSARCYVNFKDNVMLFSLHQTYCGVSVCSLADSKNFMRWWLIFFCPGLNLVLIYLSILVCSQCLENILYEDSCK